MTGPTPERRVIFGEVPDLYDRVRPSYPAALVDDTLAFGELRAGDAAVEVGPGTGKATVLFAKRGLSITGVEPSAPMAGVCRRNCASFPNVSVEDGLFEQWDERGRSFRLLYAGQSWHWVDRSLGAKKAHDVLDAEGVVALFWNAPIWPDKTLRAELDDAYERLSPGLAAQSPGFPGTNVPRHEDPPESALEKSGLFTERTIRKYEWSEHYATDTYLDLLRTQSGHRLIPPDELARLLAGIADIVDGRGGEVEMWYRTRLHLARRR